MRISTGWLCAIAYSSISAFCACSPVTQITLQPLPPTATTAAQLAFAASERTGPSLGGPGGYPGQLRCPYTFGFHGQSGSYLDRLGLLCFMGQTAWATPSHGGSGGSPFQQVCPAGYFATGIFGRSGQFVDSLGLLCRNTTGQSAISAAFGGSGGSGFSWECPLGYFLTGLEVKSGAYVDSLAAICSTQSAPIPGQMPTGLPDASRVR